MKRQQGAALLIFLALVLLTYTTLLLESVKDFQDHILERQRITIDSLYTAKEALIGYAINYYDFRPGWHGLLPCPDVNAKLSKRGKPIYSEGVEHGNCSGRDKNSLGRLPWKTLGLLPLRDGAGECLWYAVYGPFKNASRARTRMLNEDTPGLFQLFSVSMGAPNMGRQRHVSDDVVAVIIAPGRILPHQNRRTLEQGVEMCGGNYDPAQYLETDLELEYFTRWPFQFQKFLFAEDRLSTQIEPPINDVVAYITRRELFRILKWRRDFQPDLQCLTWITTHCMKETGLPSPAPLRMFDYALNSEYDSETEELLGRVRDPFAQRCDLTELPESSVCRYVDIEQMKTCNDISNCQKNEAIKWYKNLWSNWKDHLFYARCEPGLKCLTLESKTTLKCEGLVIFAGSALDKQVRQAPPTHSEDTKQFISNYLEGKNADGDSVFQHGEGNDSIICIV